MPLVAASDFEQLPAEPVARWLQLRDLLEIRLDEADDYQNGVRTYDLLEYVQVLTATAEELKIGTLEEVAPANVHEDFDCFRSRVAGLAARLNVAQNSLTAESVLLLSEPVRERLDEQIDLLRKLVKKSDFDDSRKRKLLSLLDQLSEEVQREKLNYSQVMQVLALCAAGLAGTTSFLANAPAAIATITQLIGLQKEADDSKREALSLPAEPAVPKLPAPPKQLPAPPTG